ncbi:MAG: IS110 family transposase [Acidiferrobacterales bacterium]|nr:IS110 family transposase [Acidiferrobacterales bacterium]
MSNITLLGIDLAKSVFQICGLNKANQKQFNKQVSRKRILKEVRQHPNAVIAMEACATSHYWARTFSEMGFTVRLIPAQHVKAFVRGNKNDANNALAIAEAALRPSLHPVPVKTLEQQDIQTLLRIRSRFKDARKINANQLRGLLAEYGIILAVGISNITKELPFVLENAENGLTAIARQAINKLLTEHMRLSDEIQTLENQLKTMAHQHETAVALMHLRGIGPISALALYASIGNGSQFKNARQLSAWLGLVPQHHGTGGKVQLSSISKRGNVQLRVLMIHGARTVHNWAARRDDSLSEWVKSVAERRGKHKAVVALANKTARMVWVVLNKGVDALPKHYLANV